MSQQTTPFGLVFLLWGAGLGAAAQYAKVSVIFDQLPAMFPDAGGMLGFAVSLVGLLGIIFGVVAGVLVARIGYRRALLGGLWLGAGVSALQALAPPFEWFLALRALEGLSHLALVVATPTLIAQISAPRHRGFTLTLWGTFFGVAFAVLTWGGLPFVAAFGVPALFAAHSAYLIGFALLLTLALRPSQQTPRAEGLGLRGLIGRHVSIYRSAYIAAPGLGWLFYTFCFVSVLTVLPPFLDPALRGLIMGAMPLASILSSLLLGVWLLRFLSAVQVVIIGFGASAASMAWLGLVPGDPLACLVLACALGLIQGASFAAVPQLNDSAGTQAQANGAMAQMGNLGNTLGTPIMVVALAGFGYLALPLFVGGALLAGLGMHVALGQVRKRQARS